MRQGLVVDVPVVLQVLGEHRGLEEESVGGDERHGHKAGGAQLICADSP